MIRARSAEATVKDANAGSSPCLAGNGSPSRTNRMLELAFVVMAASRTTVTVDTRRSTSAACPRRAPAGPILSGS